ncbi:hypothetical protein HID58_095107 [Brassica napus]|uniref:Uncharacterized protein n=1 Tax=Brassica napus TaxID=3708 RepID=A0ABQ7X772_BRANA|nr:hypothetical protein HID58_095107 [Brassica napus]
MMGRRGIAKVPMLLLRSWKQVQGRARISSKAAKLNPMVVHYSEDISDHRSVMDGVPEGAASFDMMFWLRDVDGVDKPDHDHHFPN